MKVGSPTDLANETKTPELPYNGSTVASVQIMNISGLSACTNESAGEAEPPDIRVSAGGGEKRRIWEFGIWE